MTRRLAALSLLVLMPVLGAAMRSSPARQRDTRRTVPRTAMRSVWDSVYTIEQATRGQASYAQTCARCHQASLSGADESPALTGGAFLAGWNGLTLGAMHDRIRTTMPPDDPGTFGRQLIADVMAYVLKVNGFPAGAVELSKDTEALQEIRLDARKP